MRGMSQQQNERFFSTAKSEVCLDRQVKRFVSTSRELDFGQRLKEP